MRPTADTARIKNKTRRIIANRKNVNETPKRGAENKKKRVHRLIIPQRKSWWNKKPRRMEGLFEKTPEVQGLEQNAVEPIGVFTINACV